MYKLVCINDVEPMEYDFFYALMTDERKKEIDGIRFEKDKKLSVSGEMLAKKMISQRCALPLEDICILKDKNGKSYAKDIPISFSISHSGDYAVCAISDTAVGVDIEQIRKINDSLIRYVCTENEKQYVYQYLQDIQKRFFAIWTAKEAYVKCIGKGISDLKNIDVLNEDIQTHLYTFYHHNYVISIYK